MHWSKILISNRRSLYERKKNIEIFLINKLWYFRYVLYYVRQGSEAKYFYLWFRQIHALFQCMVDMPVQWKHTHHAGSELRECSTKSSSCVKKTFKKKAQANFYLKWIKAGLWIHLFLADKMLILIQIQSN